LIAGMIFIFWYACICILYISLNCDYSVRVWFVAWWASALYRDGVYLQLISYDLDTYSVKISM